jgi:nickel-dependent lactate racemase
MEESCVQLPWGRESLSLDLPADWNLVATLRPSPRKSVANVHAETERSLKLPIGFERLSEMVKSDMKIALIIDDNSRPTPVSLILPAVVDELMKGGVSLQQVTVVPAPGVHRSMTEEELKGRVGGKLFYDVNWEIHDCDDEDKLKFLGKTRRGTPVTINRTVAESDLIVSIGCIEPHIIASYGGGYKNIIPGVAARETIAHNHSINCHPQTFNNVGQPIVNNPMRLDLEEGAQFLKPPVFIINAVLDSALSVVEIVSGDPIKAHRAGVVTSSEIYGVKLPALPDIVIAASYPMDQDLRQGVKALANNVRGVRKGGVMIVAIRADEGIGVFSLANRKLPLGRKILKLLAPILLANISRLSLSGMGEEDRFFLYFALQVMRHATIYVYAPTIPGEIHERLPFVTFVDSMEEAINRTCRKFPKGDVVVVPNGGASYPILPE